VSGPVTQADLDTGRDAPPVGGPGPVEITESRAAQVGAFEVRRALPRRDRRSIGAWCFIDHFGPAPVTERHGLDIGPHPHIGLQTVTWLLDGEALHRDSLGSEQVIRPGQLNLMSAGHGVAHSEEATGRFRGELHGVQLWVAQPDETRNGPPAFEHHADLPLVELSAATATVLVGALKGSESRARRETDHLGLDLDLRVGTTVIPLRAECEYGLVVFTGAVRVDDARVDPGHLAYLGAGREECALVATDATRALVVGGVPLDRPPLMWWNFVARTREEIVDAHRSWAADDSRFGPVESPLPRMTVGPPPWREASDE
jgi:redox-sensitive bicupin YhaK (pirin superfamily)